MINLIRDIFSKTLDQATIQILNDGYGFSISEHKLSKAHGDVFRTEDEITYNEVFSADMRKLNRKLQPFKHELKFIVGYISYFSETKEIGSRLVDTAIGYTLSQFERLIADKKRELMEPSAFIEIDKITIKCLGISFDRI